MPAEGKQKRQTYKSCPLKIWTKLKRGKEIEVSFISSYIIKLCASLALLALFSARSLLVSSRFWLMSFASGEQKAPKKGLKWLDFAQRSEEEIWECSIWVYFCKPYNIQSCSTKVANQVSLLNSISQGNISTTFFRKKLGWHTKEIISSLSSSSSSKPTSFEHDHFQENQPLSCLLVRRLPLPAIQVNNLMILTYKHTLM